MKPVCTHLRTQQRATGQQGFSLVELMVSMVVALLVLAGVINSFLASRAAFQFNRELAFIQDNARYATEMLARDIREAGYFGCSRSDTIIVNTINTNVNGLLNTNGIEGYESSGSTVFPAAFSADVIAGTDAVIVRKANQDISFAVDNHDPASATIFVVGTQSILPDTVMIISDGDCSHQAIFLSTGPGGLPNNHFNHNKGTGAAGTLSNCTKGIKAKPGVTAADDSNGDGIYGCGDGCGGNTCDWSPSPLNDPDAEYGPDSTLFQMVARAYYISQSSVDATMPVLAKQELNAGSPSVASALSRQEVASGIEDLEILYGTAPAGSSTPTQYFDADGVTNWADVTTVRISLVARSEGPALQVATPRTLLGVNYNDRYLRQLITTTIRVRNKF